MIWEIICWVMSSESRIALFFCLFSSRISSSISRRTASMSLPFTCERKRVYSSSSAFGSISCAASQLSCSGGAADGPAVGLGERDHRVSPGSGSESDEGSCSFAARGSRARGGVEGVRGALVGRESGGTEAEALGLGDGAPVLRRVEESGEWMETCAVESANV